MKGVAVLRDLQRYALLWWQQMQADMVGLGLSCGPSPVVPRPSPRDCPSSVYHCGLFGLRGSDDDGRSVESTPGRLPAVSDGSRLGTSGGTGSPVWVMPVPDSHRLPGTVPRPSRRDGSVYHCRGGTDSRSALCSGCSDSRGGCVAAEPCSSRGSVVPSLSETVSVATV